MSTNMPKKLQEKLDELDNCSESAYTPELFALKMLVNDDKRDVLSAQLQTFTDTYDTEEDPSSFFFEIILTIFMELIFDTMMLNHYATSQDDFVPDFKKNKISDVLKILKHKFNELYLMLFVEMIDDVPDNKDYIEKIEADRYCKVLLRHNPKDHSYFMLYNDTIDEDKDYHMSINKKFKKTDKLNKIHATCFLHGIIYKIYFDKANL